MMRILGDNKVGLFAIEFEVANFADIAQAREGSLQLDNVRRQTISGVVDPGAVQLVLPLSVVKQLGLKSTGKAQVRCADQRAAVRDIVEGVYVEILGRHSVFSAIVEPKRRSALIGATVLEVLDFLVDCTNQRLVPRDPKFVISEIE